MRRRDLVLLGAGLIAAERVSAQAGAVELNAGTAARVQRLGWPMVGVASTAARARALGPSRAQRGRGSAVLRHGFYTEAARRERQGAQSALLGLREALSRMAVRPPEDE